MWDNLEGDAKKIIGNHKEAAVIAIIAVLLFGGGFAVGRYFTPPKTVTTEKVHEVTKTQVVTQTKTEVQVVRVKDSDTQQKIHRVTVEGIDPPGCRSKTTTEDINVDAVVHDNTNSVKVQYVDRVVEKWQDKIVEKQVKTIQPLNWTVWAGVGLDLPYFLGQGQHGIPGMSGVVVQVGADRRILGPFWAGLSLNTEGVISANLKASW